MQQKRVAAIHDISGIGKCSLTVALPIISAAGIECAALPTALLSTHTGGFKDIYIKDLTEAIEPISNHWQSQGFSFNAIYSGYLGSDAQISLVKSAIDRLKGKDTLVVVDPVMGDHGKLYKTFDLDFAQKMKALCRQADIITPNITEATLMLGEEYLEPPYSEEYIKGLLFRLSKITSGTVVLTGVCFNESELGAAYTQNGEVKIITRKRISGIFHGTGDVFASVFVASMVLGNGVEKSLATAVEFTSLAIENTVSNDPKLWYGVNFEGVLNRLYNMLKG